MNTRSSHSQAHPETKRARTPESRRTPTVSLLVTVGITCLLQAGLSACSAESATNASPNASPNASSGSTDKAATGNTKPADARQEGRRLAATVDGVEIVEDDLKPLMLSGVDRAVALDRTINKVITAKAAQKDFAADAQRALDSASRDILSQLYLQKKSDQLAAKIQDADIERFYRERIRPEDFREYRVRYVLLPDASEAQTLAQQAAADEKKALTKFKDITDQPGAWLKARDLPYGLGQVVSQMKSGETSKPVALRNGYMVLRLEDTRDQTPPALKDVKAEIKNILISEAVVKQISEVRSQARIELK